MPKLILQVRTKDNLLELLAKNQTGDWIVAKEKTHHITHIQVLNWEGTQMIEGIFDRNASYYLTPPNANRLLVKFLDGRIVNCKVKVGDPYALRYLEENPPT
ncbi:hypothetical protein H6F98_01185 [Microcoleus sp. FACHB-SPT15]|uniref:hypothetical protein n=1 Tax=Microcoleus sp. FACHB-SPT15 TaxID=2692830 RepID=UPI00178579D8|nr:hypothetical protein [Microcoleus sp. FACHB-SPT15]MBD1804089.1 hypothetical protein [Microcoleus sp. FACHB-SPT15]